MGTTKNAYVSIKRPRFGFALTWVVSLTLVSTQTTNLNVE